jgi:AcrR family transcriptional regulator
VNAEKTKDRILISATESFARNGFSGAHVAKIAEKANANVTLIYRYFGNKGGLFDAVLNRFIRSAQPYREQILAPQSLPSNREEFQALSRWAWQYLEQETDMTRIALLESLRDTGYNDLLFRIFDAIFVKRLPPELNELKDDRLTDLKIAAFFFGLTPFLMASALGERWAASNGVKRKRWPERFLSVFDEVYVRYVLDWMKNMDKNTARG